MDCTASIDQIVAGVAARGLFRNPRRPDGAALTGEVDIEGREVTLRLVLGSSFPLTLPFFFLEPWDALGLIPHVAPNGFVCFLDREGLVLDRRQPEQIVADAFARTIALLTAGVRGENRADFADEFEVYWSYLSDGIPAFSALAPDDKVREVILALGKDDKVPLWIANDQRDIINFYNGLDISDAYSWMKAVYLPLDPGTILLPPRSGGPFWTAGQAQQALLSALSVLNRARLRRLVKRRPQATEYVVVKLPRPSGGANLFGIRCDNVGDKHPLKPGSAPGRLTPIRISRLDPEFLLGRGGGTMMLSAKRVLLVGCGAIGGFLALELARAGVVHLTLVDSDSLGAENTFRHVLGMRYGGRPKAQSLKSELEAQLPYVQATAIDKTIEAALAGGQIDLAAYDLMIFAIGNPTVELSLNERLHAIDHGPRGLFAWLEPLGIGGHVLLTGNDGGGCFECLYTPPDGADADLANRAAFAAPGQSFGRALSGCGSLHTPYGSADAVQTANLAARLAVNVLTGKERGNPLLSWKGDAAEFIAAGFRSSARYEASEEELGRHRYAYHAASCRVCGNPTGIAA